MFTNEFDHDEIIITILDDFAYHEDMQIILYDDLVYIRQWSEEEDRFNVITISPDMFNEFVHALNQTEGAYYVSK